MKPNNPRKFGIILTILLTFFTSIAHANNIQCTSTDGSTPDPLPRRINIDWKLNKDSFGYYLVLNLLRDGDKYPLQFLLSLLKQDINREKINMRINGKTIAMYKLTILDKPFQDCEIVIFQRADSNGAYLGYFKYIPDSVTPSTLNNHWAVASDYYSNPDLDNGSFINSYNFVGGLKYSKDPSQFQKLDCHKLSD